VQTHIAQAFAVSVWELDRNLQMLELALFSTLLPALVGGLAWHLWDDAASEGDAGPCSATEPPVPEPDDADTEAGRNAALGETLVGSDWADVLDGRGGNDRIEAGRGNDTVFGGTGADTVLGGAGDDSLWGHSGDDLIDGHEGADSIGGGAGADTIFGGAGNDSIAPGTGRDVVDAGAGDDLVTLWPETDSDRISLGEGNDWLDAASATAGFEAQGGAGNDVLVGGAGSDSLFGDEGDDTLIGGMGDDLLIGGVGYDVLRGGAGADVILGGTGDVITFDSGDDRLELLADGPALGGWETPVVTDYVPGEDEVVVQLSGLRDLSGLSLRLEGDGSDTLVILSALDPDMPSEVVMLRLEGVSAARAQLDDFTLEAA
jgi:Ca2+-binding RTX toxin-like protein